MWNHRFAHDIILFAESEENLNAVLKDLKNEGKRDGMKLNIGKTNIMCNDVARGKLRAGVTIGTEQYEEVTEYKY